MSGRFSLGDLVCKTGEKSQWRGRVCGTYRTALTEYGYVVQSLFERHSVQCWPESALEPWRPTENEKAALDWLYPDGNWGGIFDD